MGSVLFVEETEYQEKPPTCRKSLTNFVTLCCIAYTYSKHQNYWAVQYTTLKFTTCTCTVFFFCKIIQSQIDLFSNKHNVHRPNSNCPWNTYLHIIYKQQCFHNSFYMVSYFSYLINIGSSNADIMFLSFSKKNVKNNVKWARILISVIII